MPTSPDLTRSSLPSALPPAVDVAIIGAGIIGVSTAYALAQAGVRVAVFEKGAVACEQSSRNWGWVRTLGRELPEVPLALRANQLWGQIQDRIDVGFRRSGILYLQESDADAAGHQAWIDGARAYGIDARLLGSREARGLLPQTARNWTGAMYSANDGVAEPQLAAPAIAALARKEASDLGAAYGGDTPSFGRDYLIPRPFDRRLLVELSSAVAQAAMDSGVATRPIADMAAYRQKLAQFVYRTSLFMKPVYDQARADKQRVVYAEGEEEVVLRAVQNVIDEGVAFPILIGRPDVIESRIERLGLRMKPGVDFEVTNINDDPRFNDYWQYYHGLTGRRGVTVAAAKNLLRSRPTLIAAVMVARGEADAMLSGVVGRFHKKLGYVRSVIPLEPRVSSTSAMTGVINSQGVFFFVDTHVQEDPSVEQIVESTLQAAYRMKLFGIEPKVALLSHSNFGSHDSKDALKMRQVREQLLKRNPRLNVDGEMQGDTAWDEALREKLLPNSTLKGRANLFVLPNLEAANIAYNLVRVFTDGVAIGPILMGISKPVHILTSSASSRRVLNMTAIAAVDAQIRKQMEAERGT